jgi:phosphoribosylformimino-5-aminoimidazole carboxamide ribotide isomerase
MAVPEAAVCGETFRDGPLAVPTLYPAVDILGGKAVRLEQGDYQRRKVYDSDPLDAARRWVADGAAWLHVVDLDGAREGRPVNLAQLERIAARAGVPVQFGGGLRSVEAVADAVGAGADRVVVGTVAFTHAETLDAMLERAGERVWVAVDVRAGTVTTAGWMQHVEATPAEAAAELRAHGIGGLVYTSVDRDGTLGGPDTKGVAAVAAAAPETPLLYSGGVGTLDDLEAVAALRIPALRGVIVGKALYEQRFTVAEAQRALGDRMGDAETAP